MAADLFGYTAFNENDTDIGQRIEELAPHLDFICPMVYPSGYHKGIPGHPNPMLVPGKVVSESVRLIRKRAGVNVVRVRPWLQDFKDYAFDRRIFGVTEVHGADPGSRGGGGARAGCCGTRATTTRRPRCGASRPWPCDESRSRRRPAAGAPR